MAQNLYPLGDYNTAQILEFVDSVREAKSFSKSDEFDEKLLLYRRPDAAPNASEFVKAIPKKELPLMVPDAFSGKIGLTLAANLTMEQLETIGAFGDVYLREAIKANLLIAQGDAPNDAKVAEQVTYVTHSPAWQL